MLNLFVVVLSMTLNSSGGGNKDMDIVSVAAICTTAVDLFCLVVPDLLCS